VVGVNWITRLRYGLLANNRRAKLASRRARKRVAEFDKNPQGRGRLWMPLGRRTLTQRGSEKRHRWPLHVYGRGSSLTRRVSINLRAPSRMRCDRADLLSQESAGWIVCGSRKIARTNPSRVRWQEMHNLFWKLRFDQKSKTEWHLTTWTECPKRTHRSAHRGQPFPCVPRRAGEPLVSN
jgi:hypothetical protein